VFKRVLHVEWARGGGQGRASRLTPRPGFRKMKLMVKHRTHGAEFKRQVVQEYLVGETLHGLSNRHDLSRNLIRIWVDKYQAGALDEEVVAADLLETYDARIAALERLVGKQALELEFLKGAPRAAPRPRSAPTSAMVGPTACPPPKDERLRPAEHDGVASGGIARSTLYDEPRTAIATSHHHGVATTA